MFHFVVKVLVINFLSFALAIVAAYFYLPLRVGTTWQSKIKDTAKSSTEGNAQKTKNPHISARVCLCFEMLKQVQHDK